MSRKQSFPIPYTLCPRKNHTEAPTINTPIQEAQSTGEWRLSKRGAEKTFESPWDSKEINPLFLKEINSESSLEGLMLKLSSGHLM